MGWSCCEVEAKGSLSSSDTPTTIQDSASRRIKPGCSKAHFQQRHLWRWSLARELLMESRDRSFIRRPSESDPRERNCGQSNGDCPPNGAAFTFLCAGRTVWPLEPQRSRAV